MKKIQNHNVKAGEWITMDSGDYLTCCDCGLAHKVNFKVGFKKNKAIKLYLKAWRASKLTQTERRRKNLDEFLRP